MKKILLGTTTLIGAAGLFAGAALADTPKVTIGGYADFQVGAMSDDFSAGPTTTRPDGEAQRTAAFRSDTQITFRIDGKTDAGLGYGGGVDLLADTSADARDRGVNASKTFVYLDGAWGRTEMGSEVGAEEALKVDASTIARATGGIAGDWVYYANSNTAFLASPSLPVAYGAANAGNGLGNDAAQALNKVTYYTPRFAGVQVGVSYLPDEVNRGQGAGSTADTVDPLGPNRDKYCDPSTDTVCGAHNIFTGGINYEGKFDQVGIALAATGEEGQAGSSSDVTASKYESLKAWNLGGKVTVVGVSLAGSYGNEGKSDREEADHAKDATYWTAGAAYEFGPFGASLTYLNSTLDCGTDASGVCNTNVSSTTVTGKNKLTNWSAGVDYKLAPGLTPYAEVTFYKENSTGTANDDRGTVGIVGTQLAF